MEPGLLVLGPAGCGRKSFAKSLAFHLKSPEVLDLQATDTHSERLKFFPVTIDTKYYICNTKIWYETTALTILEERFSSEYDELLDSMQALILVFDASREESFDELKQLVTLSNTVSGLETKMVVANMTDKSFSVSEDQVEDRKIWCLENGFEYIETNSIDPVVVMESKEKKGTSRVIEALHATMWRNMEIKSATSKRDNDTVTYEKEENQQQQDSVVEPEMEKPEKTSDIESSEGKSLDYLLPEKEDRQDDESEMDDDVEFLFKAINEINHIREVAKSATDKERRKRATDMTLKLMSALNWEVDD